MHIYLISIIATAIIYWPIFNIKEFNDGILQTLKTVNLDSRMDAHVRYM